jgi:hypothetical protein
MEEISSNLKGTFMDFRSIPKLTRDGRYKIHVSWDSLEWNLQRYVEEYNLDLDPDFQREHVWTEEKQIAYVEHVLRGGQASNEIRFNCIGWQNTYEGPMVLVDGKQRLNAVRRFLRDEIKAFGHTCTELQIPGHAHQVPDIYNFIFYINDLDSRAEVLKWYLELNSGGVVHSQEELDRVRILLSKEA